MKKLYKYIALGLVALSVFNQTISAQSRQNLNDVQTELRIKNEVAKRGTGEKSRVVVTLLDRTTVKGFISQISDDTFTITDKKTRGETVIPYNTVAKVKKQRKSKMLALGIGIAAAAVIAVAIGAAGIKGDILH